MDFLSPKIQFNIQNQLYVWFESHKTGIEETPKSWKESIQSIHPI